MSRKRKPLPPAEFDQKAESVIKLLRIAVSNYKWAASRGYVPEKRAVKQRLGKSTPPVLAPDPTGEMAVSSAEQLHRARVLWAGHHLNDAAELILEGVRKIQEGLRYAEAVHDNMEQAFDVGKETPDPPELREAPISRSELEERRANQARHQSSGRGWGEA